jgi:cytochrome c-type biogenesis protein CcsB
VKKLPLIALLAAIAYFLIGLKPPKPVMEIDTKSFGMIPVLANGRVKPLDTVARNSLLSIRGKQTLRLDDGKTLSAIEWLTEVLFDGEKADKQKIFLITHPDVLSLFGWVQSKQKYFSFEELKPHLDEIDKQGAEANKIESQLRTPFQREIYKLYQRLILYHQLKNSVQVEDTINLPEELALFQKSIAPAMDAITAQKAGKSFNEEDLHGIAALIQRYNFIAKTAYFRVLPPETAEGEWQSIGTVLLTALRTNEIPSIATNFAEMSAAYQAKENTRFQQKVADYHTFLATKFSHQFPKADYEVIFNHFEPFYKCMVLYVLIGLIAWASWLSSPQILGRTSFFLLLLTFAVHTIGLVTRMYLQGRPPVTNLYSSAIFVGWGAVLLCIVLERIHKNGIGTVTAAVMGFLTLLIAHHLAGDGDTIEIMRAVLDSNFWLSTHVVVVTLGYASTFLAGFLAIIYVFRSRFEKSFPQSIGKSLEGMVYGIVCFATLFSFVGTILGGIWADQSWGRFWGWDPKENGALLIVLWNAIILHARWGKYIERRGLMTMAVFGNIVTSFSWFGVNMLGVGLHSYGFIDKAFFWLAAFIVSQLAIMALSLTYRAKTVT